MCEDKNGCTFIWRVSWEEQEIENFGEQGTKFEKR